MLRTNGKTKRVEQEGKKTEEVRRESFDRLDYGLRNEVLLNIWFFDTEVSTRQSIEEADDLASNMPLSGLVVGEDALARGQHQVPELPGGQDVVGPPLEVSDLHVESGRDDRALVDSAHQLHHDLLGSVIVDHLELADVAVALHDLQEPDEEVAAGPDEHLLLAPPFCVDDGVEGVTQNVDTAHSDKCLQMVKENGLIRYFINIHFIPNKPNNRKLNQLLGCLARISGGPRRGLHSRSPRTGLSSQLGSSQILLRRSGTTRSHPGC